MKAQQILDVLMRQEFERWYATRFEDYITGERKAPTRDQILEQITKLFNIEETKQTKRNKHDLYTNC